MSIGVAESWFDGSVCYSVVCDSKFAHPSVGDEYSSSTEVVDVTCVWVCESGHSECEAPDAVGDPDRNDSVWVGVNSLSPVMCWAAETCSLIGCFDCKGLGVGSEVPVVRVRDLLLDMASSTIVTIRSW